MDDDVNEKGFLCIVFVIYIGLLIWVIMLKCNLTTSIYDAYVFMSQQTLAERFTRFLIPFKSYSEDMFGHQIYTIVEDDILNTIVFIPFGLYMSYFIKLSNLFFTYITYCDNFLHCINCFILRFTTIHLTYIIF